MSNNKEGFKITPEIMNILLKADPELKPEELHFNSIDDVWVYLKSEENKVDEELSKIKLNEIDLQSHMEQLHQYNNMKDITQEVLGALANVLKISVSEAHQRFNLADSS